MEIDDPILVGLTLGDRVRVTNPPSTTQKVWEGELTRRTFRGTTWIGVVDDNGRAIRILPGDKVEKLDG